MGSPIIKSKIIIFIAIISNFLIFFLVLATAVLTPIPAAGQVSYGSIKITIDHTKILSPLINFPILINLNKISGINSINTGAIFNELGTQYKKISIKTSGGTELYAEVEKWNNSGKEAWIWVNVPSISSTSDTVLYLNYSSSWVDNIEHIGDTGSKAAENVWNSEYKTVMHMAQDGKGEYKDSTRNHHGGTGNGVSGSPTRRPGWLEGNQFFDGNNDYISIPDSNDFSLNRSRGLTIEWWFNPTTLNFRHDSGEEHYINMLGKGDYPDGWEYVFTLGGKESTVKSQEIAFYVGKPSGGIQTGGGLFHTYNIGDKIYVAGRLDAKNVYLTAYYADGFSSTDHEDYTTWDGYNNTPSNTRSSFHIGTIPTQGQMFEGIIDEVRISNIYRSDAWLHASYYSELDNLASYSIASVTTCPTTGDLNGNGITADAGDLVLLKHASIGKIQANSKYDLNNNGKLADAGDLVLIKAYSITVCPL
ncbi:MAG TPA: DUF2341 domain-containing protein [Candidatus Methylomirabilis sp.]|nr:DUF2341 domain-containing protein [Candidatus Methylomirabilis sp.]